MDQIGPTANVGDSWRHDDDVVFLVVPRRHTQEVMVALGLANSTPEQLVHPGSRDRH